MLARIALPWVVTSAMEAVSSVTAFLFRYARDPIASEVQQILEPLSANEQEVLRLGLGVRDPTVRVMRLAAETGEVWTPARYARVEAAALNRLRAELERRGLLKA